MTEELERFVASLAIPADRKAVVLAELSDHVACAREAAAKEGRDPDQAARAALGSLEALRRSLEAVEPAFRVSRWSAFGRGVVAALLVAIVVDCVGFVLFGVLASLAGLAITIGLAPPRALELLRAELRAGRVRGTTGVKGLPIGPAVTYAYTAMSGPFLVWIGLIVYRAEQGVMRIDVPRSAFVVMFAIYGLLLVEAIRARRATA